MTTLLDLEATEAEFLSELESQVAMYGKNVSCVMMPCEQVTAMIARVRELEAWVQCLEQQNIEMNDALVSIAKLVDDDAWDLVDADRICHEVRRIVTPEVP